MCVYVRQTVRQGVCDRQVGVLVLLGDRLIKELDSIQIALRSFIWWKQACVCVCVCV